MITQFLENALDLPEKILFLNKEGEITARDFLRDIAGFTETLRAKQRYALCFDEPYHFLVALFSVLLAGSEPVVLPNNQSGTLHLLSHAYDDCLDDQHTFQATNSGFDLTSLDEQATLHFFTSGSTAEPKCVKRSWSGLVRELCALEASFANEAFRDCVFYRSVSHQHIYGLTFGLLWPLMFGRVVRLERIQHQAEFRRDLLNTSPSVFISSPAFLSRLHLEACPPHSIHAIFSAGSALRYSVANQLHQALTLWPIEIFGSTETGAVAFRQQSLRNEVFEVFPTIRFHEDESKQCIHVRSPFSDIAESDYMMSDTIRTVDEKHFELLGRASRVVKVEGKRVSLCELEHRLSSLPGIAQAAVTVLNQARECTAALLVLNEKGVEAFVDKGRFAFCAELTLAMNGYFDTVIVPKQFRFIDNLPQNPQGKLTDDATQSYFNQYQLDILDGHCDAHAASIVMNIRPGLVYFKGHFENQPILPGVAQLHIISQLIQQFFDPSFSSVTHIENMKFTRVIQPNTVLKLVLSKEKSSWRFSYSDRHGKEYSSGKVK